jgi:hypothetical protein
MQAYDNANSATASLSRRYSAPATHVEVLCIKIIQVHQAYIFRALLPAGVISATLIVKNIGEANINIQSVAVSGQYLAAGGLTRTSGIVDPPAAIIPASTTAPQSIPKTAPKTKTPPNNSNTKKPPTKKPTKKKGRRNAVAVVLEDRTSTFPITLGPGQYFTYEVKVDMPQDALDFGEGTIITPLVVAKGPLNLNILANTQVSGNEWALTAVQNPGMDVTLEVLQDLPPLPMPGAIVVIIRHCYIDCVYTCGHELSIQQSHPLINSQGCVLATAGH